MSDAPRPPAPQDPVRGVFLADLAHDLSTPLTAIHGAVELMLAGAYGPLDELVPLPSGTMVPKPVAKVCELTYYCEFRDIHARTSSYRIIAKLIANTLPRR